MNVEYFAGVVWHHGDCVVFREARTFPLLVPFRSATIESTVGRLLVCSLVVLHKLRFDHFFANLRGRNLLAPDFRRITTGHHPALVPVVGTTGVNIRLTLRLAHRQIGRATAESIHAQFLI